MPTLRLHGPPQWLPDDGAALPLSAREAALVAWLHLEGPTPRAQLAGRLWPGGDDAKARANLRQTLLRLKRSAGDLLREDAGVLALADHVVVAARDECRHALRRAFGIGPSTATNQLGRRILTAEVTAVAPVGAVPALPRALLRPPAMVGGRPGDAALPGALASRLVAAAVEQFDPVLDAGTRSDIQRLLPGGPEQADALKSSLEHRRVTAMRKRAPRFSGS